jgi:hypothetical protein
MSITDHLDLFKAGWISDPEQLKTLARKSKYNDLFTAEIAAWCAEIHEHLRDLAPEVGVELMLMGGNAASLRFDAIQQRGSRDNDYLTVASHADIQRLMDTFAERFAALHPLFLPSVYQPKNPTAGLARPLPAARHRRTVHRARGWMDHLAASTHHGRDRPNGESQTLQERPGRPDRNQPKDATAGATRLRVGRPQHRQSANRGAHRQRECNPQRRSRMNVQLSRDC